MKRLIQPLEKIYCGYVVHYSSKRFTIVLSGSCMEVQSISLASSEEPQRKVIALLSPDAYLVIAINRGMEDSGIIGLEIKFLIFLEKEPLS